MPIFNSVYKAPEPRKELCFTANTAWSTVKLTRTWSPTSVTLETSIDWTTWNTYTLFSTITLSNVWDKVYFRNTSTTDTWFSQGYTNNYYYFVMQGSLSASWDVWYLLNKNSTNTMSNFCFCKLFLSCPIKTTPKLPATTLASSCYREMFESSSLEVLPKLPATALASSCYMQMFYWCSKIKLSTTQTWEYQTEYRVPISWTWTDWGSSLSYMFQWTWWTFTWTPSINTTYYTSNAVV